MTTRKYLCAAVASAALVVSMPAIAGPGGGRGGDRAAAGAGQNAGAGEGIGRGALGGMNNIDRLRGIGGLDRPGADVMRQMNSRATDMNAMRANNANRANDAAKADRASKSQGPNNASANAFEHASANSVLNRGTVPSSSLPGLAAGLTVDSSTGASLGTVTSIQTTANGSIRTVVITGANGQMYSVPAAALSINGSMVTVNTSMLGISKNGLVQPIQLPGLTTGLTVDSSTGTSLGTVTSIQTTGNGSIRTVVITDANGHTYTVPASALSINGNTVTLNTSALNTRVNGSGSVSPITLPGLTTGLTVDSSTGTSLGTVTSIQTLGNGQIKSVVVTDANGNTYTIPASQLSINGNVVTVNAASVSGNVNGGVSNAFYNASLNAFAHANANSALYRGAIPAAALPGLATGLTVQGSTGATLGTVTQILSNNGLIAGVVVTDANGVTYRVPASQLTVSGSTVTVNTASLVAVNNGHGGIGTGVGTGVPVTSLPGLATGLTVDSSTGASLGTVTSIQTLPNGQIGSVTVTAANGQTYTIPASQLSINGSTVSVNSAYLASLQKGENDQGENHNGQGNENDEGGWNSGVPIASLPGLTTGLSVALNGGTSVGTVTSVITDNGRVQGVVVTTSTGQTVRIPASALSISGSTVSVNTALLGREGLPSAFLPGLTTGLTVQTAGGTSLGTVTNVIMEDGQIKGVVVTTANGQTYRLPASALSVNGSTVTASLNAGFYGPVPSAFLPGLTTGLNVQTAAGTSLGTVSQVITTSNGSIVGVVVTAANGQVYRLSPADLSINGNVVTTAQLNLNGFQSADNDQDNDDQGENQG